MDAQQDSNTQRRQRMEFGDGKKGRRVAESGGGWQRYYPDKAMVASIGKIVEHLRRDEGLATSAGESQNNDTR